MTIWGVEWVAFQVTAWYLDQVTSAGTGTARHPLFFLGLPRGPAPGTRPLLPSSPPPPPPPFPLPPAPYGGASPVAMETMDEKILLESEMNGQEEEEEGGGDHF